MTRSSSFIFLQDLQYGLCLIYQVFFLGYSVFSFNHFPINNEQLEPLKFCLLTNSLHKSNQIIYCFGGWWKQQSVRTLADVWSAQSMFTICLANIGEQWQTLHANKVEIIWAEASTHPVGMYSAAVICDRSHGDVSKLPVKRYIFNNHIF